MLFHYLPRPILILEKTIGHLERGLTPGVEAKTEPFGQGFANDIRIDDSVSFSMMANNLVTNEQESFIGLETFRQSTWLAFLKYNAFDNELILGNDGTKT